MNNNFKIENSVSDRFNIYFPILILLLCMGTWFRLGTRCLSSIGFAQFLQSDELTVDLIEEGKALVNRGNRRLSKSFNTVALLSGSHQS